MACPGVDHDNYAVEVVDVDGDAFTARLREAGLPEATARPITVVHELAGSTRPPLRTLLT